MWDQNTDKISANQKNKQTRPKEVECQVAFTYASGWRSKVAKATKQQQ